MDESGMNRDGKEYEQIDFKVEDIDNGYIVSIDMSFGEGLRKSVLYVPDWDKLLELIKAIRPKEVNYGTDPSPGDR